MADGFSSFLMDWFHHDPPGAFSHGHLFMNPPDLAGAKNDPALGYWHCDIAHHERLTWSDKVYDLFGLPTAAPVERNWAVSRYCEESREALNRVRTYALTRRIGFLLDAEIRSEGSDARWVRILAVPILEEDRVVGLHGLKRAL